MAVILIIQKHLKDKIELTDIKELLLSLYHTILKMEKIQDLQPKNNDRIVCFKAGKDYVSIFMK